MKKDWIPGANTASTLLKQDMLLQEKGDITRSTAWGKASLGADSSFGKWSTRQEWDGRQRRGQDHLSRYTTAILTLGSFSWATSQDNEILCFSLPLANGQEQQITLSFEKQLPWLFTALLSAFFLHTETQLANRHVSVLHLPSQIPQAPSLESVVSAMVPRKWCSLWQHSFW